MLVVQRFASVLLQMQALDANALGVAINVNLDFALADDRLLVLRDLIALGQIRIEIILPVEDGARVDFSLEAEARANGLGHALFVDDWQHAGHCRIDQRYVAVGFGPKRGR